MTGHAAADPIATCAQGCPAFESERNAWSQMPASVQLSAAERITFDQDVFVHLGQHALGNTPTRPWSAPGWAPETSR